MTYVVFSIMLLALIAESTVLYISIKRNLAWMELFEDLTESYKETLQELQVLYNSVNRKSKMELFLDEPVTRELIEDIKGTKKAIKDAAEKISVFIDVDEENEEKEN
jgi:hypothetical protein